MKVFLFVFAATIFEASGDAVIRLALHNNSLAGRVLLFVFGAVLLALYGTSLNLAPVDFAAITGWSQWVDATLSSNSPWIENKS